ncbi:MAG: hypothetical protein IMF19_04440 [Proteobacteria bacterium]|nr:hypothetical protein [Pseudomonadota bacterium]
MSEVNLFKQCIGLNNRADPSDLLSDPESGLCELAVAVDVDIDRSGKRISRKKGYTRIYTGKWHSLYPFGNNCLCIADGNLIALHKDKSYTIIQDIDPVAKVSYVTVGDRAYFSNGIDKGYVIETESFPWGYSEYVGPPTDKKLVGPLAGYPIEIYNGFMFITVDNFIFYSMPFSYHSYCLKDYLAFPSKVKMVKAVKDGLYISDETTTYYLNGDDPREFFQTIVADYPVIPGTEKVIDGRKIGKGDILQRVIMWTSREGICLGGPDGLFLNLTMDKLVIPDSSSGAGICIDDKYVCALKSPAWSTVDGYT